MQSSGAEIRRSSPEDAESFRLCLDAVARERLWLSFLSAPPLDQIERYLSSSALIQFLAARGTRVVGWCDVTPKPLPGFQHSGVLGMGLLPEFRGQGLGKSLLLQALQSSREAGIRRVELEVYASNRIAISLYEKHGFLQEGIKHSARILDGHTEDIVCMALITNR